MPALERGAASSSSLIDVLDRVLDKGIVIDRVGFRDIGSGGVIRASPSPEEAPYFAEGASPSC
jgi:hypothetical protein